MRLRFAALASLCVGLPALAQPPTALPPAAQQSAIPQPVVQQPATQSRPAEVYHVELIVFRATAVLGAPEDWSAESGGSSEGPNALDADPAGAATATATGAATPTATAAAAPTAAVAVPAPQSADRRSNVQLLPASDFELDRIAARLRASGRYVPVAHVEWSQTASPWDRPIEIPIQGLGIDVQGLTGSVSLARGEFLHLALLLDYAMDDPPPGLQAPPGTVFTLHDSHRVRLDERNYFDHPAFGVIALVTPARRAERPPGASLKP